MYYRQTKETKKMKKQQKLILLLAIASAFIAAMFLPGLISAGDLEPFDPPGSTMKTLDQIPPIWSQILPASERFELVMGGLAVLDKETGLVWEQSPDTVEMAWASACSHCFTREVANRKGWRLPTVEELASLVDNDNYDPALPTGHPFSNVQSSGYWSSTPWVYNTNFAWGATFLDGVVGHIYKGHSYNVWCVRSGYGHDIY
jgi:hypothetical protein